ncbi:MAG: TetR/AcrR family transcriptional regulator [Chloroflexi bacterium]|nr:TetR/AcrR family transcriptional regulator [Chloroflexota bacterium]
MRGHRSEANVSGKLFGNGERRRAEDRRVRRTRRLLREALVALILEKGYDKVTVQDVLDRADLGRATFYAHFRDKDDLLVSGFEELQESLREHLARVARPSRADVDPSGGGIGLAGALFDHAGQQRRLYRVLMGRRGGAAVFKHARGQFTVLVREHLEEAVANRQAAPPVPLEVTVQYVVSAFLGLLTWWLDSDPPYTGEQMGRMFEQLVIPGVRAGLGPRL